MATPVSDDSKLDEEALVSDRGSVSEGSRASLQGKSGWYVGKYIGLRKHKAAGEIVRLCAHSVQLTHL